MSVPQQEKTFKEQVQEQLGLAYNTLAESEVQLNGSTAQLKMLSQTINAVKQNLANLIMQLVEKVEGLEAELMEVKEKKTKKEKVKKE
jgi:hypothetical protein